MDSLSFDDLIPQQDTAEPTQPEPSLSFDDLVPPDTVAGAVGNAGIRSGLRITGAVDTGIAEAYRQRAEDVDRSFGEIVSDAYGIPEGKSFMGPDGRISAEPGITPLLEGTYRYGMSRLNSLFGEDKESLNKKGAEYFELARRMREQSGNTPRSKTAQRYEQAIQGGKNILEVGWNDPAALAAMVGETAIESAPSMAAAIGAGAITRNPAVGAAVMGTTSGLQERYGSVLDFLSENGVDLSNPEQTKKALFDKELMAKAQQYGLTRGAIIGTLDGISGLAAGKALSSGVLKNFLGQMGLQAGFGGAGEGLAQGATKGWDKIDWNDVGLEALAEFATAPIEVIGVGQQYLRSKNKPTTEINVEEVLNDVVAGTPGARETLVGYGIPNTEIDNMVARRAAEQQGPITQVSEKGADAAESAAINATKPENNTPIAPKRDELLEVARRRDQRGKAASATETPPATPPVTPASNQQAGAPTAVAGEPPTAVGAESAAPPISTPIDIGDLQLAEIPFDARRIDYTDPQKPKSVPYSGKSRIIDYNDRKMVVVNINGVQVPFYLSTGGGGKKDVAPGKWYPFFGIGADGWINKTSGADINKYYGIPELKAAAEKLDRTIGDIRGKRPDDVVVNPREIEGPHIDFINSGLAPVSNKDPNAFGRLRKNIADIASRISSGTTAPTENLKDIGKMASGITGSMYDMLWSKVQKGDTRENGVPSAVLEAAKMVRERGGLKTLGEFQKFAQEVGAVDRGQDFQSNMRALVEKYATATPNDEITANVPEAPTEVTPEVTVPESQDTLNIQRAELVDTNNARTVVQYPKGTNMKLYPKPDSPRIERFPSGKYGTFDFDASKISRDEIRAAARAGKLNELLGLGPYNKQQVAESAAAGAAPVAVTERTPGGTEVKAAAGTEETAPEQLQALEEAKAPGNTVQVEDPAVVIEERIANAPTQEAPTSKAEQAKETSKARAEKTEATSPKSRVLEDLTIESRKAKQEQAEQNEIIADQIKPFLKGRGKEKTLRDAEEKTGKNWTPAERAARRKLNEDSDKLVKEYAPTPQVNRAERDFMDEDAANRKNARAAIRARAEAMLKAADAADISLPEKVYGNTDKSMDLGAGAMNLVVARDFLDALKSPYKPAEEHYIDFLSRDMRLRKGLLDEVVSERRTEIDDKIRQKQGGNIEQIATNTVGDISAEADTELSANTKDVANPKIVGKDDVETKVSRSAKMAPKLDDGTQKGELTIKTEDSEGNVKTKKIVADVAKPASAGKILSKEEKERVMREMGLLKREDASGSSIARRPLGDDEVIYTTSLTEAMDRIGKLPGDKLNQKIIRDIMNRLRSKVGGVDILVVEQDTLDDMFNSKRPGAVNGYYDPKNGHIVISGNFMVANNGRFDASLLVHEGVHAYLQAAVDSSPNLKKDIQDILDYVKSIAPPNMKNAYGLRDVHEFLSEALSNPTFQNFLASTNIPDSMRSKYDAPGTKLWQKLVKAIADHFGYTSRKEIDALSYTMRLVERAEDVRAKLTGESNSEVQFRERSYADELTAAGVPADVAAELDAFINAELGKAIDPATLDLLMEDLKAEYGQDTSVSNAEVPEEEAEKKAKRVTSETKKQAKRMMRATTKSREELLDEAYLQALEEFKPGRVPKQNSKALLSLLMNNQLALISDNFFGRDTNPVRRIADLIEMRRTGKQSYVEELGEVAQKLYDLERVYRQKDIKAWEKFVSLAHDATMAQVHPDKPLSDEIHKYLGDDDAVSGKWSKKQHPRLATMYNSLPGDLRALYRETRDALSATRDRVELGNISTVLRKMGHNDEALAKRFLKKKSTKEDRQLVGDVVADYIKSIVRLSAINGPYFNLARQGDIVLTGRYKVTTPSNAKKIRDGVFEFKSSNEAVKFAEEQMLRPTISRIAVDPKTGERFFVDEDGTQVKATFTDPSAEERYRVTVQTKYVEFFHSEAAAREKAEALKDVVELNDVEPKRVERAAANAEMLSDQMRALASTLDTRLKGANLTTEQKAVLKGTLNEASLRFMASTRLQTHRLPRRYVQGASKDLVVSTYQYIDSSAGYLAKLDTQVQLEDAMRLMEKGVNALSSRREGIGGGARAISNEVERRVNNIDYNMDQGLVAGAANRIMAVNFINHLMSPMYTVLQVLQTPLVAGPVLSAEYGAVRTSYHLAKASKDIGALQIGLKGIVATAKGLAGINTPGRTYTDYARARLGREEQRAIDKLIALGVVDSDAGFDVTRLERKDNKIARGVDATLEYFGNIARAAPQSVEAINRAAVGLATFRMARADKLSFEEAVRKAQEAVELTHFNLSASNAAPIFRNPVGRLLLQFKKYGQNIYFLHYYNAARMIRPKVAGDRLKGAKTLLYLAATHQVAAGLVGLPIEPLKIAVMVLGMIPGMPEWEDLEREAEEALADLTGKDGAEALMYGLPNLAGIDISSRVGLSSLLLFGEPGEMGDKDSVQAWFLNLLLGPTVGSATDIASGVAAAAEGDPLKAAEKLLPVKVISDTLRAVGEVDDGKFDTEDALLRAFGVQSSRQARIQRDTSADIDNRTELKRQKNSIIKAWLSADTAGERSKVIARMREYNKEAGKRDKLSTKFLNNIKRREERKYQN